MWKAQGDWEGDEKGLVPERNPYMWWVGLCPNHHMYGSLLRARRIFITLPGGVLIPAAMQCSIPL